MTTPTPRTDAAVAFVWGQVKDEAVDDLPRYTIETLGATMRDLERDLAAAQEALDAKDARIKELEGALLRTGAWEIAPCCICGYNGPGYYQPDTHACANRAREALK